ncbi:Uncharacterized protein TCAP_03924 [Tolypocladium capitatum]|uniref:Uncharacterized protein n=1 Tax=Tolypocladium capitatum TaxID=45235 RepID=A0A2K3QF39_9HYPO|nr:Uncharacterized protein TCAP_03924 [Tolypocladium capitatum]
MDHKPWTPMPFSSDKPYSECTREEILWYLRTDLEGEHRHSIHFYMHTYTPSVRDINRLPEMSISDFLDTCNKSVPVYIPPFDQRLLLSQVLHNYIYRRWFRPYRSEIEHQRFICKFITPQHLPSAGSPSQSTVDSLVSLNRAICAEVEARRLTYEETFAAGDEIAAYKLARVKNHRLHILQPLFKALLIIVCFESYRNEDSKTVGRLPVFLVRTGVEDGLSAPVSFKAIADKIDGYAGEARSAIRTTLETAVDFVMDLEAREATVFGLQPNPADSSIPEGVAGFWKAVRGDEPLVGPSSKFVDIEKYPSWAGNGESYESWVMPQHELRAFHREAARVAGEFY